MTVDAWQELWERSGFQERVVNIRQIDGRQEVKDRIGWIGRPWLLRAWYRFLGLYLKYPSAREFIKDSLSRGTACRAPTEEFGKLIPKGGSWLGGRGGEFEWAYDGRLRAALPGGGH